MRKTAPFVLAAAMVSSTGAFAADPVEIHGFVSQAFLLSTENQYLAPNSKDGTFDLNEVGVNFGTNLGDKFRISIQLFARDLGDFGNETLTIDWAYGDYRVEDWFGLRIGKIKLPLGLYGETRDTDSLRNPVLLPQAVYNETFREVLIGAKGVGLYGDVPLGSGGSFTYQGVIGSVNVPPGGAVEGAYETWIGGIADMTTSEAARVYMGQVEWRPPVEGLRLAVSNLSGSWGISGRTTVPLAAELPAGLPVRAIFDDFSQLIASGEYVWKDLTLASEYYRTSYGATLSPIAPKAEVKEDGWYASAAYRFSKLFEAGTYYSVFYTDREDRKGAQFPPLGLPVFTAWQKDLALTARFDISKGVVAKLEGHLVDGTGQLILERADVRQDWVYVVAKVSYTF